MKPPLETLPPETIDTLITWCHASKYTEVSQRAAKPIAEGGLDLRISPSTLCRLYATHNIADSKEARAQYAASLGADCKKLRLLQATRENIEQRLFEITARPDATVAELRLASQFVQRADSLSLSHRRVRVAEKREARIAAPQPQTEKPKLLPAAEVKHRVRVLLGKEAPRDCDFEESDLINTTSGTTNSASQVSEKTTVNSSALNLKQAILAPETKTDFSQTENPNFKSEIRPQRQTEISKLKPEISPNPRSSEPTGVYLPSSESSVPSVVNRSTSILQPELRIPHAAIQAAAQLHANLSYPDHLRPGCPIYRKIFDEGKQHCLQQRILTETENWLKAQTQTQTQLL